MHSHFRHFNRHRCATSTDTDEPLQLTQKHIHFHHFNRHRCATSTDTDAPLQQTQNCTFIFATSTDTDAPLQQTQMHIHFRHFNRHRCATSTDANAHSFPPLQQTQMQPLKLQEQLSKGHKSQQSRSACKYPSELSQSNRPVYIQCA